VRSNLKNFTKFLETKQGLETKKVIPSSYRPISQSYAFSTHKFTLRSYCSDFVRIAGLRTILTLGRQPQSWAGGILRPRGPRWRRAQRSSSVPWRGRPPALFTALAGAWRAGPRTVRIARPPVHEQQAASATHVPCPSFPHLRALAGCPLLQLLQCAHAFSATTPLSSVYYTLGARRRACGRAPWLVVASRLVAAAAVVPCQPLPLPASRPSPKQKRAYSSCGIAFALTDLIRHYLQCSVPADHPLSPSTSAFFFSRIPKALFSFKKFCKIFQIFCHIKSLYACIKY